MNKLTPEAIRGAKTLLDCKYTYKPERDDSCGQFGIEDYVGKMAHEVIKQSLERLAELLEGMPPEHGHLIKIHDSAYEHGHNDCRQRILNILEGE